MKNWIIVMLLMAVGFNANASDFEIEVGEFSEIKAMGKYKVTLKQGDANKVEVFNGDEEDLADDRIVAEVDDDELVLRLKGDTYGERDLEIVVTYVNINKLTSKLGCHVVVESPLKGEEVKLISESGGKIKAEIRSDKVIAEISAGGSIHLDGETGEAEYKISMGGTIGAVSLAAVSVKATVTAGGEIICSVEEDLSVKITSGGNVSYMGEPEGFEQNITLGGKITKLKNQE